MEKLKKAYKMVQDKKETERKMAEEAKGDGPTPTLDEIYEGLQEGMKDRAPDKKQKKIKFKTDNNFYGHTKCQTLF